MSKTKIDIRAEAAKYYDLQPDPFTGKDINFYRENLPSRDSTVLEIGCGTGRVLIQLAKHCKYIVGIDISESMIAQCKQKLKSAGLHSDKAMVQVNDVGKFRSSNKFDLIIAPFRVFQNIDDDNAIEAFFNTIRFHLADNGKCILNVFKPFAETENEVRKKWDALKANRKVWEHDFKNVKIVCYDRISNVHPVKFICYPILTYELYENNRVVDTVEMHIAMRCYSPADFIKIIEDNGFIIEGKWGGYSGEVYGKGPELVAKFRNKITMSTRIENMPESIA
ncbi:MAG: class I SAM-dependent methyltransferase [Candidatus Helarchaeota archaeon]|nr:class I SAM-dependent methyltransferase [Candidatus Helarchaeota archaeon]